MSELFRRKYRVASTRLRDWNYATAGAYFVTIVTKNREECFGEIRNGVCELNDVGCIVATEWQKTESIRANVELDAWVVMPNHVHGIVVIGGDANPHVCRDVAPQRLYTRTNNPDPSMSAISPKSGSLSTIIHSYKSACTMAIHEKYPAISFAWQPRFHDHIIRDDDGLNRIREYIQYNPTTWETDELRV